MFVEDRSLNPGVETKADPFSLDALIGWLEKQPGEIKYDYRLQDDCLLAKYVAAAGGTFSLANGRYSLGCTSIPSSTMYDEGWPEALTETVRRVPWTFGAALQRARELRGEHM